MRRPAQNCIPKECWRCWPLSTPPTPPSPPVPQRTGSSSWSDEKLVRLFGLVLVLMGARVPILARAERLHPSRSRPIKPSTSGEALRLPATSPQGNRGGCPTATHRAPGLFFDSRRAFSEAPASFFVAQRTFFDPRHPFFISRNSFSASLSLFCCTRKGFPDSWHSCFKSRRSSFDAPLSCSGSPRSFFLSPAFILKSRRPFFCISQSRAAPPDHPPACQTTQEPFPAGPAGMAGPRQAGAPTSTDIV